MQAALSKLEFENEELRSRSEEMLNENKRLTGIISSWTRSSALLDKLHGVMKSSNDKTGLGYNSDESSRAETSCTPQLERTNFQTMKFVKSSAGQPVEAQSGEINIEAEPPIWKGRFFGLGYIAPEKSRESWLRKRVQQMRGKPKSDVKNPSQPSQPSTKDRQYKPMHKKPRSNGTYTAYSTHTRTKYTQGSHMCFDPHTDCLDWSRHEDIQTGKQTSHFLFQLVHLFFSACSWSSSFQLIHFAPAGSTWPPPDYEQLIQLWTSPLLIQLPYTMINQTSC
ncbi:spindle pole body component 110-like [Dorcoceras hygrometricum]|uniref:Spindle pole body component 110-like n=1 Tax=Dorcoceras hygrometricum TaxID=472368 RepID=A0A2Z7CYW0_9LAMI|nr:spindle pole body component 110-like [Dorcoceras hygrometricum]